MNEEELKFHKRVNIGHALKFGFYDPEDFFKRRWVLKDKMWICMECGEKYYANDTKCIDCIQLQTEEIVELYTWEDYEN